MLPGQRRTPWLPVAVFSVLCAVATARAAPPMPSALTVPLEPPRVTTSVGTLPLETTPATTAGLTTIPGTGRVTTFPLTMSSEPDCTQCHLLWLDEFGTTQAEILVPYRRGPDYESGVKNAESTELMCYSCHDGYVVDSRVRLQMGYQHPMVGISALGRKRPPQLPLLEEEQVYCGTCHTPHGPGHESEKVQLEANAFLRMAQRPGVVELCTLCHEYATTTPQMGNHPVNHTEFQLPEVLRQLDAFPSTERGGIGCQSCHNLHGAENPLLVVLGGREGSSATLCIVCHKYDYSKQGIGRFSHPIGVTLETSETVPRYPNGEAIALTEDRKMSCMSCHDIHESAVEANLLRFPEAENSLCTACHPGRVESLKGTGHDLGVSAPEVKNALDQTASQGGVCSACHVPHKGRLPYMWARLPRGGQNPVDRLCVTCHGPGGVSTAFLRGPSGHPSVVDKSLIRVRTDAKDPSLSVPVFDARGMPAERGEVACATCHNAHQWEPSPSAESQPAAIGRTSYPPPGEGDAMNSFLRLRSQDQICKHCHGVWALWRYKNFHLPFRGKR